MHNRHMWLAAASALAMAGTAGTAFAQEGNAVEEVVVTAQKRAENIQDVPLSIMAVSSKAMEAKNVVNVRGLERIVPNLRIDTIAQSAGVSLRIRGFGASSNAAIDPSVAPYIDGVFIPRPGAVLTTFLDVESAEVLRGPQGTLFGRNATVGAISLRTAAPGDSFAAKGAAEIGAYGTHKAEGMVNVPVNDQLALRFALTANETDGYIKNRLDGKTYGWSDTVAGRASARVKLTDDIVWTARLDYARTNGDGVPLNQVDTSTASAAQLANFTAKTGQPGAVLTYPPSREISQAMNNLNLKDRQYGLTSDLSINFAGDYTARFDFTTWNAALFRGRPHVGSRRLALHTRACPRDPSAQRVILRALHTGAAPDGAALNLRRERRCAGDRVLLPLSPAQNVRC